MRLQRFDQVSFILLVSLFIFFSSKFGAAQDDPPAPQFLYRDGNRLVLVDGYTGESRELSIEITERDRFEWSPDGQYLLSWLNSDDKGYCLNLYDVNAQSWVYDEPISCHVQDAVFSPDGAQIAYTTSTQTNGTLWLYGLEVEISQQMYQTTYGDEIHPDGVGGIRWSPAGTFLTFIVWHQVMGGTLNTLVSMNILTQDYFVLNAPDTYYASYNPIWSADDRWFLITLKEAYEGFGPAAQTNHEGDVYLVNSETGEVYRLTYTPAIYESDVHWTDEGKIAYSEVMVREEELTTDEAMNVEAVPSNKIITPEPVDEYYYLPLENDIVSPNPSLAAWIEYTSTGQKLVIGDRFQRTANFSVSIPESYYYGNILIGWRPYKDQYGDE